MNPFVVLDTSQPLAVVAVVSDAQVLGAHVLAEQRRHAEGLVDALDQALLAAGLDLSSVAGVAVGRGPGSFIGIRTGIAFAKGLGLGRRVPVVGIPSLLAIAHSAVGDPAVKEGEGWVVVDAKRGEVFAQRVRFLQGHAVMVSEPVALSIAAASRVVADGAIVIGGVDPAQLLGVALPWVKQPGPSAAGLALALRDQSRAGPIHDETDTLVPDYRREADAKLPAADPSARRDALLRE